MADDKKSNNPPPNPAKAVKAPQLPTKTVRDDGSKLRRYPPKGERK